MKFLTEKFVAKLVLASYAEAGGADPDVLLVAIEDVINTIVEDRSLDFLRHMLPKLPKCG